MAAELRLGVAFDLVYFRQQLKKLGRIAASEFTAPIKIKLDRRVINSELNNLQKAIKRRKYTIELNIAGSLSKDTFEKLQERLDALSKRDKVEIPLSIKNGIDKKDIDKALAAIRGRINQHEALRNGKIDIGASIQPSITNKDVQDVKNAAKEKLDKLAALEIQSKIKPPSVAALVKALKKSLKRQDPLSAKAVIKPLSVAPPIKALQKDLNAQEPLSVKAIAKPATPAISKADVTAFKNEIEEKLSGIVVKVKADIQGGFAAGPAGAAGLYEYMRTQGLSGGNVPGAVEVGRETRLRERLSELTVKDLKKIAKEQDITGVSNLRKDPLIDRLIADLSQDVAEGLLGNIKNQMRQQGGQPIRRSFLDQIARAIFYMAGVDPAYLRQQAAQRRALPGINFPATVPPGPGIGPSGTGRLLVGGASPRGLPGTAFGGKGFLPPQLGVELKEILRDAASAFVQSLMAQVRKVSVRDLGRRALPALPGASMRGLLPSAVGRAPSLYGQSYASSVQDRIAQAYQRSALRGAAVMAEGPRGGILGAGGSGAAGPYRPFAQGQPGGAIVPYRAPSFDDSRSQQNNFKNALGTVALPGEGAIREIGSEFAFAAKQIVLFGQAYKLLGFLQSFPGQVADAVGKLQSFRNTLNAIIPTAEGAASANQFILGLVERYNVPLQSARDGFTKLYASMAPAGFEGGEIAEIFTGVTKAAATFGMSADQVDRVNYAFAQMASKGQVMTEEVKGQLGDVLPGAVALFAKAAGFEGPKAIQDFSAAMEDGRYKGEAMVALIRNVGKVMNSGLAKGAEGAANTFQGAINGMQTAIISFYETFEPAAAAFLNGIVKPLTEGIKEVSDAFNIFLSGSAAKTTRGLAIANELEKFRPSLEGIRKNVIELTKQFVQMSGAALGVAKVLLQIAGNPIIGYLLKLYAIVLPLNLALNVLRAAWVSNIVQMLVFKARIATGTRTLAAFKGMMVATGATAKATALTIRTLLSATGIGLALVGISLLIEKLMSMNQALADTKAKALGAAEAIRGMSATQAIQKKREVEGGLRELTKLEEFEGDQLRFRGKKYTPVSKDAAKTLEGLGVPITKDLRGKKLIDPLMIPAYKQQLETAQLAEAKYRVTQLDYEETRGNAPLDLEEIPQVAGDEKGGRGKTLVPMELVELTKQLNAAKEEGRIIDAIEYQYKIDVLKASQETEDIARREISLENAASKRRVEYGKLGEEIGKQNAQQLIEESEGRKEIFKIQNEQLFAAGEINAKEYERVKFLAEQRDLLEDFGNIPGVTDEDKSLFERLLGKIPEPGTIAAKIKEIKDEFDNLADSTNVISTAAVGIGESFSRAFTDVLTGAQTWRDGLAGAFKSVAGLFADLVAQMLAKWAALQILGLFLPGQEGSSLTAGIEQYPLVGSANGNVLRGGFAAFANGGMVTGPTLGLVGEGRFNEAVVPLPNGKSIPVDLGDGTGNNISTNIVVNMNNGQSSSKVTGTGSQAFGREIEGAVRSVILKETRPGGIIYGSR